MAAAIRDARLNLARRKLSTASHDHLGIATIAYTCGFPDIPVFNRRRRFGLTPSDLRALRD